MMNGDPIPRGGERQQPNPLFVAHAAALTELYVTLAVEGPSAGLSLLDYRREGEAREAFELLGKQRALAPDATVILADEQERQLAAFFELDLGTLSHTRMRLKADLYAAYTAADDWQERHLFLPALLFLTPTETRARRFLVALQSALARNQGRYSRRTLVAGRAHSHGNRATCSMEAASPVSTAMSHWLCKTCSMLRERLTSRCSAQIRSVGTRWIASARSCTRTQRRHARRSFSSATHTTTPIWMNSNRSLDRR